MKKLFLLFALLVITCSNIFTAVPILFYSAERFPEVNVKFMLVDNTNRVVTGLSHTDAGIVFNDNNNPIELTSFDIATVPDNKASIVVAFDLSISQRTDISSDFSDAIEMTSKYLSYLSWDGQTEISLISLSGIPSIEVDFTSTINSISIGMNNFTTKSFGNIYKGITLANTGALAVLEDASNQHKSILLVTQGVINKNEADLIIAKAKQSNVVINILYVSDIVPKNIKRIADETGGFCINKYATDKIGLPLFSTMAKLSEGYTPYALTANANINCDGKHIFRLQTNNYGLSEFTIELDNILLTKIETKPSSLEFPFIKPSTSSKKDATIYARNTNLKITDIQLDNPSFNIENKPSFPYYLNKDDSLELRIIFTPPDSCIAFTRLIVVSDACSYDTLFITGGYPNVPPKIPTIKFIKPRCNDVLIIGDTIEIKWTGVLPSDVVSILSEKTDGVIDTVVKDTNGLTYQYIVKDKGKEDSITFIINQMWPNNIGKTLDFKHNAPVLSAFWNNSQNKIITTSSDNLVTVWNANTGAKIHTFSQFSKLARWAIYAPNPKSFDDNYIGVACHDSCVYIFNANDYSIYYKYKAPHSIVWSIEFSADCKYAVITLGDGCFEVLDIENKTPYPVLRQRLIDNKETKPENCRFATFHPTKPYPYEIMAISGHTGIVNFFDITGNLLDTLDVTEGLFTMNTEFITYNHDGAKILFSNYQTSSADYYDRDNGTKICSLSHNANSSTSNIVNYASFYKKEEFATGIDDCIITAGKDGVLRRWNMDCTIPTSDSAFKEHNGAVNTGVLNKDGWRMLSASDDSLAKIWNLNQKVLQADTTCKLRIAYAKGEIIDTLYFGNVFHSEIIIKTFNNAFFNICDFAYNIRAIRIVDAINNNGHPADFDLVDEFDFPLNINGQGKIDFSIAFEPSAVGIRTARLQIILPNDTLYICLIGNGLNIGLKPLCEFIDFGNVFIDDYKDTLLNIAVNVADVNINVTNIDITGPQKTNFKIINDTIPVLKPNDTLSINIRFFPITIGKKNAMLNINHSYHSYPLCFNKMGKGTPITNDTVLLNINDLTVEAGKTINCPIILNTLTNYNDNANLDEIIFSLIFNSSVIYPQTNSKEVKILKSNFLENGNKIIDVAIPYKLGQQHIDGLQLIALFGNDTMTTIQVINSKAYNNSRYFIKGNTATFTIINNCNAGGEIRLFDANGKLSLHQNVPNPSKNNETKIEFDLIESGYTSLDLFDITGKHIRNIFSEDKLKGNYSITINTKDLPAGMYYYILYNVRQRITRNMIVE